MCPPSNVLSHVPTGPWFQVSVTAHPPRFSTTSIAASSVGPKRLAASFALYQRISKTRSVGIVFKKSASPALCPFNQTRTPTLCSPSLGDRGSRVSSCRENQRGRSMWTRSYAVAPLKLARSISSVVRMFDLRFAYKWHANHESGEPERE